MKASIPRIVLRTALGAAGCAYASLVLLPGSALASWLSRIPPIAQAIAFPSIAAAGTVLATSQIRRSDRSGPDLGRPAVDGAAASRSVPSRRPSETLRDQVPGGIE